MPRTREQFSSMKDERRESIVKAALPLFAIHGPKVSIDAISEKAKCSHGIVYHYFKNTDEIYAYFQKSPAFLELISKFESNKPGSSYEKIEDFISVFLDIKKNDFEGACYRLFLLRDESKNSPFVKLCSLIKDGQNALSIIGGEPTEIVHSLFTLFRGIYLPIILEKHPNVQVPSIEMVMQLIRKPLSF